MKAARGQFRLELELTERPIEGITLGVGVFDPFLRHGLAYDISIGVPPPPSPPPPPCNPGDCINGILI